MLFLIGSLLIATCESTALSYDAKTYPLLNGQCPSSQERERVREEITMEVRHLLNEYMYSCNGSPGWKRVVLLDMSDPTQDCPPGLVLSSDPPISVRSCRSSENTTYSCDSTIFNVSGEYSQVCGRIKAYQYGLTYAFYTFGRDNIDELYVTGVSLTHGAVGQRQHIWTFASGYAEINNQGVNNDLFCPNGSNPNDTQHVPFVGEDYFCESGNVDTVSPRFTFYQDDPLWDGMGCGPSSTCCQFNSPPWFCKTLRRPTTDDLEVRICHSGGSEDTPVEFIELYVQ